MKKLFLSLMLLALPLVVSAYDCQVDGIYYNLNSEEKTAEVTYQSIDLYDNITSVYSGSVDIPERFTYDEVEYTVASIGYGAFYNCGGLTSVTIPNSVTSVAGNAFQGCNGLPVENGMRYAGSFLIEVVDKTQSSYPIKEGTRFIADRAFYDCRNLTSVEIPNSVITIGERAFCDCRYLTSVALGNSVRVIEKDAFRNCMSLNAVHISDLEAWCKIIFYYGLDHNHFPIENSNPLSCAHHLFLNGEEIKDLIIPNSITSVLPVTFYGCSGLTSITIPSSVCSIGYRAFYDCSGLTSVTIPKSVKSIEDAAFWGCNSLNSVNITDIEAWCNIHFNDGNYDSYQDASCNPIYYAGRLFVNGEEIKELIIPNSISDIGSVAFNGFSGMTSLIIPNTVTSIGELAFIGCNGLEKVTCYAENVPNANWNCFDNFQATLYVPSQSLSAYKRTSPWSQFKFIYAIEDGEPDKCATPTIRYENKEISFDCKTEGVEFVYEITDTDIRKGSDSKIKLSATYEISVYATKSGYYNSDVATATLVWTNAIFTETTPETPTSAKAVQESIPVLISAKSGNISVRCEDDGQEVNVYTIDGLSLGTATVKNGEALISTSIQSGDIAVVKVGGRSVKVIMR